MFIYHMKFEKSDVFCWVFLQVTSQTITVVAMMGTDKTTGEIVGVVADSTEGIGKISNFLLQF